MGKDTRLNTLPKLTIPELIKLQAHEYGDKYALVTEQQSITYAELDAQSTEIAKNLINIGVDKGDRIAIWAPNMNEWVLAAIATHKAGAVIVPINTRMKGKEAAYILNNSEAKILFSVNDFLGVDYFGLLSEEALPYLQKQISLDETESPNASNLKSLMVSGLAIDLPLVEEGDIADIIFTSGTTGKPKGVISTHGQNIRVFDYWSTYVGLNQDDKYLIVNPFFHTFGYKAGWLASIMKGATAYPCAVFDAEKIIEMIHEKKISMLPGPPTLYQSILASENLSKVDISSLRLGVTGAASIPCLLYTSDAADE